ncbi:hypothetical protein M758_6G182400 [Ceratodon purpureus]|nr:hypothetical protein M758_6G182400 [Ceratodon purpureus]
MFMRLWMLSMLLASCIFAMQSVLRENERYCLWLSWSSLGTWPRQPPLNRRLMC